MGRRGKLGMLRETDIFTRAWGQDGTDSRNDLSKSQVTRDLESETNGLLNSVLWLMRVCCEILGR